MYTYNKHVSEHIFHKFMNDFVGTYIPGDSALTGEWNK